MADVMDSYFRGLQAGQAEKAHQQQLEDNKLRSMVLRHEIDRMKLEDQLRARDVAKQNLDLLHGQPAADIPSESITTQQPNLPSTSRAGVMTGLPDVISGMVRGTLGGDGGGASDQLGPGTLPAPAAQAPTPQSNPITTTRPAAVNVPGVEALGVPGVSVRPQSREDMAASERQKEVDKALFTKMAPGDVVPALGPTPPAGPKPVTSEFGQFQQIYAEGLGKPNFAALTPQEKAGAIPAFTKMKSGGVPASEFGQFQQIYAEGLGAKSFGELTPQQKAGVIPAFNQMKSTGTTPTSEFGQFQQSYAESLGKPNFVALTPQEKAGVFPAWNAAKTAPVGDVGVQADVRTTSTGKQYVDLSKYKGKEYSAAQKQAHELGVYGANAGEADALSNIETARQNFAEIGKSIGKLPTSAGTRLAVGPLNKLEAMTQMDPDLAAWGTYRSAAIQALRAMAGSKGLRINKAEIETSMANDIPNITDTQATAKQKLDRVEKMLANQEKGVIGTAGTVAPSGPTTESGFIEAVDPQGGVHHAPAGTPLPPGWKLKAR